MLGLLADTTSGKIQQMEPPEDSTPVNDTPHVIPPEFYVNATPEEMAEVMLNQEYIDITNGFPSRDSRQFVELIIHLLDEENIGRYPIVGTNDGLVFVLTSPSENYGKMTHTRLVRIAHIPHEAIAFTTSLEGFSFSQAGLDPSKRRLACQFEGLTCTIPLQSGSDILDKKFTNEGQEKIKEIFEKVPGISYKDGSS